MRGRGGRFAGRGRGAPGTGPVARDDEGNVLPPEAPKPPPLFPEIELPEFPELNSKDKLLLIRRHELIGSWRASPCFLEKQADTKVGLDAQMTGQAVGGGKSVAARPRPPLSSVVTFTSFYFPEELWSQQDKRAAGMGQGRAAQAEFWKKQSALAVTKTGLQVMEDLARMEGNARAAGGGEGAAGGAQGEEEEGMLAEEEDEDDDVPEDDDYVQGDYFDDDEGYDVDDDGPDEGPIF